MIQSMTGFGRGQAVADGVTVTVELNSVNSRYLNISFRIPREIQQQELAYKEQIQAQINRGKLSVAIRVDDTQAGRPELTIRPQLAVTYKRMLEELRDVAQINEPVTLKELMQFDEIFGSREQDDETIETMEGLVEDALGEALRHLIEMREQEGRQLEQDLSQRVENIRQKLDVIKKLTNDDAAQARDRLKARIAKLVDDETLDEERLEMEVAILVDKMDITEELVRLTSHVKFFKKALENQKSVGRRLKFLAQEMNREINTIGSKANNADVSQYVVDAKESLEQIKEQVANVE